MRFDVEDARREIGEIGRNTRNPCTAAQRCAIFAPTAGCYSRPARRHATGWPPSALQRWIDDPEGYKAVAAKNAQCIAN